MNRVIAGVAAVLIGMLATIFVASMPTQVDGWDCGGRIGRVAIIGPFHSTGGEPGASTDMGPSDQTCTSRARLYLVGAALSGLAVGSAVGAVGTGVARRSRRSM